MPRKKTSFAIRDSEIQEVPDDEVDFEIMSPSRLVGSHANVVPLSNNAQSARLFYASRFLNQAMPLANREAPLVQSLDPESPDGLSFEEQYGRRMGAKFSDDDATVLSVDPDEIQLQLPDGSKKSVPLYNNFQFNRKTYLKSKPQVKVGDVVKKGQILASTNFTDDKGTMSMGITARVAMVPYKGYSMDDAIVVSESFAKRMASEHNYEFDASKEGDVKYGKAHFSSLFPMEFTRAQLDNLDDNGVAKPGTVLHKGDPIILATRPKPFSSNSTHLGKLSRAMRNMRVNASEVWEHDYPGIVSDSVDGKKRYKVFATASVPMQVGDKMIAQRVGQKCYSDDTEILTEKRGWVLIKDLQEDDKVAALFDRNMDPKVRESYVGECRMDSIPQDLYAKFAKPLHVVSYAYDGVMYGLDTEYLSYLVTPNHRVWCGARKKGTRFVAKDAWAAHMCLHSFMKRANFDLSSRVDPEYFEIPMAASAKGGLLRNDIKFSYRLFIKFLAIYLAEGNVRHSVPGDHSIIITQKERPFCRELEGMFDALGFEWKRYNNQYRIAANKSLATYLRQFGKANEKYVPEWVFQSSKESLQDFVSTIWQGDGDKDKGKHYWSSSPALIDGVARILALLGKATSVNKRAKREHQNFDGYELCVLEEDVTFGCYAQKQLAYYTQEYNGNVYCVQVPGLGVILTRRNGKIMWNGNSIVSKILPDEHMLRSVDGKPFEVLLNPLALPSRVNTSAVYELALGKLAAAEGKPIKVPNYNDPKKSRLQDVLERLQKAGISDTEEVFDPVTNKKLERPVTTGFSYIYKLHHVVESKKSARGQGAYDCYSADTEVLTEEGWKFWPDVTLEDKLATIYPDDKLEYVTPAKLVQYDYEGDLFHFHSVYDREGEECIYDLLVTPNHNVVPNKGTRREGNNVILEWEKIDAETAWEFTKRSTTTLMCKWPRVVDTTQTNFSWPLPNEWVDDTPIRMSITKAPYKGKVYCATIQETGVLMVRRNGSEAIVSGNSDGQPLKGGSEAAQAKRLGGLETTALMARGAYNTLREASTLRGSNNQDYWRLLRQGYNPPEPGSPFVWDKFRVLLNGSGYNAKDLGKGKLRLSPFTDRDLDEHKPVEVLNGKMVDPETLASAPGGLFSEELVSGNRWGKITLPTPLPNPAFENQIQVLLGITNADLRKIIAGEMTLEEAQSKKK